MYSIYFKQNVSELQDQLWQIINTELITSATKNVLKPTLTSTHSDLITFTIKSLFLYYISYPVLVYMFSFHIIHLPHAPPLYPHSMFFPMIHSLFLYSLYNFAIKALFLRENTMTAHAPYNFLHINFYVVYISYISSLITTRLYICTTINILFLPMP